MKYLVLFSLLISPLLSQQPTAEQIITNARLSTALQQAELTGIMSGNGKKVPVALFLKGNNIQFQYNENNVWKTFHLRLNDNSFDLFEIINGKTIVFPNKKISEYIAGTDLTYEDLAMRFFYWKNPQLEGVEKIGIHSCWKIRLNNPGMGGAYVAMYVWVHQKYGAFMKIEGFDKQGKLLKRFEVDDVQNIGNNTYTLKQMTVNRADPNSGRVISKTKLIFDNPKLKPIGGRR